MPANSRWDLIRGLKGYHEDVVLNDTHKAIVLSNQYRWPLRDILPARL